MSHEHRALGFRPPPGSLAAEAQAAAAKHSEGTAAKTSNGKPRRNSNDPGRKPRQNSVGANGKQRRGSSETRQKQPRGSNDSSGQTKRRSSNESQKSRRSSNDMKRTSSDQGGAKANGKGGGRRASSVTGPSTSTKEDLLREAALRDAERIK